MVDRAMPGELRTDAWIDCVSVRHQETSLADVLDNDRLQALAGDVRNMEAADLAATLDQRQDNGLFRDAVLAVLCATANEGFVSLNDLVLTAKRAAVITDAEIGHSLADAMPEEPRGFHPALEGALQLADANALLAGAHQVDRLEPHAKRHVAGFHDGAHLDSERLAAGVALAETVAGALAVQSAGTLLSSAAMRADRAIGPQPRFNKRVSRGLAVEMGFGKDRVHGRSP